MIKSIAHRLRRLLSRQTARRPGDLSEPGLPDWRSIIATNPALWQAALERAESGPRVLMATAIGGHPQFTVVESALAVALTLRGAKVDILLCDEGLPACLRAKVCSITPAALDRGELASVFCGHCVKTGHRVFDGTGLRTVGIREQLDDSALKQAREISQTVSLGEAKGFRLDGLPIGEHGLAGSFTLSGHGDSMPQKCEQCS